MRPMVRKQLYGICIEGRSSRPDSHHSTAQTLRLCILSRRREASEPVQRHRDRILQTDGGGHAVNSHDSLVDCNDSLQQRVRLGEMSLGNLRAGEKRDVIC